MRGQMQRAPSPPSGTTSCSQSSCETILTRPLSHLLSLEEESAKKGASKEDVTLAVDAWVAWQQQKQEQKQEQPQSRSQPPKAVAAVTVPPVPILGRRSQLPPQPQHQNQLQPHALQSHERSQKQLLEDRECFGTAELEWDTTAAAAKTEAAAANAVTTATTTATTPATPASVLREAIRVHEAVVAATGPCRHWENRPPLAHSSDEIESPSKEQCKVVFTRFQELLLAPHQTMADLRERFVEKDVLCYGVLDGDSALQVLTETFAKHSHDMPLYLLAGMNWKGVLKRYGVYGVEDRIGFDECFDLYRQVLETARDAVSFPSFLRVMEQMARSDPKLNDGYVGFELNAKDSLGQLQRCRARHTQLPFSCRQIRKDRASVPVDRIREQLRCLQELEHPQIPKVVEHFEDFHNFYIIFLPLEGLEILEYIQSSYAQVTGLTEAWVAGILQQVLQAMAYCHARRPRPVVHRDLRPSSVLVSPAGTHDNNNGKSKLQHVVEERVSVLDFGLKELFDKPRIQGMQPGLGFPACGESDLLAPEIWQEESGPKCDVWACGCLLFLLLSGSMPFNARLPMSELRLAVETDEPDWDLLLHVSTSAVSLCQRMLAKDDRARPSAAQCLRHPWFTGNATADIIPRTLQPATLNSLMQVNAESKLLRVLMNIIAAELQACQLHHIHHVLAELHSDQDSERVGEDQFGACLTILGVSDHVVKQVLRVVGGAVEKEPCDRFFAGCVELVEDKLDSMLWRLFTMVDDDHSGEMSVVVFRHFLEVIGAASSVEAGGDGAAGNRYQGDVEHYLCKFFENAFSDSVIEKVAGDRGVVTFEAIKQYLLQSPASRQGVSYGLRSRGNLCSNSEHRT